MQVDLYASESHYYDHLRPIWEMLPEGVRGNVYRDRIPRRQVDHTTLVAGYKDVATLAHYPVIYVEHGAGQSYEGLDISVQPFYSGGPQHRNVVGFICPNDEVVARWRARYPDKPAVAVGCPRLDPWHAKLRGEPDERTVAITFHWDAQMTGVPETTSAFSDYLHDLGEIIVRWRADGWTVLGHNHPRHRPLAEFWKSPDMRGLVEYVESVDEILDRASVLVADNTSVQAEFLSLGRGVVWLNRTSTSGHTYRKDRWHGGRFWHWPMLGGQSVDTPTDLANLDLSNLPPVTGHPYAFADGRASWRAASAVVSFCP
jgi:hypothetical protein